MENFWLMIVEETLTNPQLTPLYLLITALGFATLLVSIVAVLEWLYYKIDFN